MGRRGHVARWTGGDHGARRIVRDALGGLRCSRNVDGVGRAAAGRRALGILCDRSERTSGSQGLEDRGLLARHHAARWASGARHDSTTRHGVRSSGADDRPAAPETTDAPAPIVFFDIAGPDGGRLQRFYADVFGWRVSPDGTFTTTVTSALPATIRQDPAETVIYIGVKDVTATLAKVQANGGTMQFRRLEVPGRVVLGMFKDLAGNRVGLVELENGRPKIP